MSTTVTIRRPDDFHVHFREGQMLKDVAPLTAKNFGRALVMPNLKQPILNGAMVHEYRQEIMEATRGLGFTPLMTIKITAATTPKTIRDGQDFGVIAGKLYPEGVTTNSEDGVRNVKDLYLVFAEMERVGMVLSIHGEKPTAFVLDREKEFLPDVQEIVRTFPKLKVVLEHITTVEAVEFVESAREGVAATITIHHLLITLHDLLCFKRGGNEFLNPHLYCKPIAKYPRDREALVGAALSSNPKFFFGSDSAPHPRGNKESGCGCAGVFTAPVALPLLVKFFIKYQAFEKLEPFTSEFGARFYGLRVLNLGTITLEKKEWLVPGEHAFGGVVPFMSGEKIAWQIMT